MPPGQLLALHLRRTVQPFSLFRHRDEAGEELLVVCRLRIPNCMNDDPCLPCLRN